jgi:hypothetical protein
MEKIMSKSNDASNIATLEDHGTLVDTELAEVTGGVIPGFGAIYTQMISDNNFRMHGRGCEGRWTPEVSSSTPLRFPSSPSCYSLRTLSMRPFFVTSWSRSFAKSLIF